VTLTKPSRTSFKTRFQLLGQTFSSVQIDRELKVKISRVCSELNVDGLRGALFRVAITIRKKEKENQRWR
jgi:Mg-chelatase subunit ChlI